MPAKAGIQRVTDGLFTERMGSFRQKRPKRRRCDSAEAHSGMKLGKVSEKRKLAQEKPGM
jgi:hypothetical protein